MSCSSPIPMFYAAAVNPSGRRSLVSDYSLSSGSGVKVFVQCNKCIRCKLKRALDWSIRIMHEASLYSDNCFITLTYDDLNLPDGRSLLKSDFQKFMKRLRKHAVKMRGRSLRYYACGEYGDRFGRPHYHAILLDFDFKDKVFLRYSAGGERIFSSKCLESLWSVKSVKIGICEIGSVTSQSAGYVARYCTKKITGDLAVEHYRYVDAVGRDCWRVPEFSLQSQSIGKPWLERFHSDVYTSDFVLVGGAKLRPPRAYDKIFEVLYPEDFSRIKRLRRDRPREVMSNGFRAYLVREEITRSKLSLFMKRNLG